MAVSKIVKGNDTKSESKYLTSNWNRPEWIRAKELHEKIIDDLLKTYLTEREHQQKDPILDFLFEYYRFSPSKLKRWSPGFGPVLNGYVAGDLDINELKISEGHAWLDINQSKTDKLDSLNWIKQLLESTASQMPSTSCFGLHEWAMIYQSPSVRHSYLPLRFSKQKIEAIVDDHTLLCTHYDAFRFFTSSAKPKNAYKLSRETFTETEQPGCIHSNMDLYKWAFKYYPWISSNTIRNAFLLALKARTVDMQASPYDLTEFGLSPIKVETAEGKKQYVSCQKKIYHRSVGIRKKLIDEYDYLISALQSLLSN